MGVGHFRRGTMELYYKIYAHANGPYSKYFQENKKQKQKVLSFCFLVLFWFF